MAGATRARPEIQPFTGPFAHALAGGLRDHDYLASMAKPFSEQIEEELAAAKQQKETAELAREAALRKAEADRRASTAQAFDLMQGAFQEAFAALQKAGFKTQLEPYDVFENGHSQRYDHKISINGPGFRHAAKATLSYHGNTLQTDNSSESGTVPKLTNARVAQDFVRVLLKKLGVPL